MRSKRVDNLNCAGYSTMDVGRGSLSSRQSEEHSLRASSELRAPLVDSCCEKPQREPWHLPSAGSNPPSHRKFVQLSPTCRVEVEVVFDKVSCWAICGWVMCGWVSVILKKLTRITSPFASGKRPR